VFVPNAEATPLVGTTVEASGVLRRFADTTLEGGDGWNELDVPTRERLVTRPVLVATSLTTATGRQLTGRGGGAAGRGTLRVEEPARSRLQGSESLITVPPATLAVFIQSLAGHSVRVPNARVVGVFTPRVFLIDSQSLLYPVVGNRSRVLVFIQEGTLRVTPESLVASIVTVSGTARTLLGMQTTRDVPWPASLNRSLVERLEIHAALLAKSVQTAEGVDLTVRSSASPPAGSSQRP
jgi:hypothetical protein